MQPNSIAALRRITLVCPQCSTPFQVMPSRAFRKFCSHRCASKGWRGSLADRFWAKAQKAGPADCWIWQGGKSHGGYGVTLNAEGVTTIAHRVAWELTHGAIPEDQVCCHRCDVRLCVNPAHLFLGTQAENLEDMRRKGRNCNPKEHGSPGSTNHNAKLTEDDVRTIRTRYALGGITQKALAAEYGVVPGLISQIITRYAWKHIA